MGNMLPLSSAICYRRPHPPLTRSPFSYKEKALMRPKKSGCSLVEHSPINVIWSLVSGLYIQLLTPNSSLYC